MATTSIFLREPDAPSLDLTVLTWISRLLPPVRGAARIAFRCIRPLYRGKGPRVLPIWGGLRMKVDPFDYLGGYLSFLPHLYDRWERNAMTSILRPGDLFIDVGSNIGAYTIWAAQCVGQYGRVLAIEADEQNHQTLLENIRLNAFGDRVRTRHCGISDKREVLPFHRNTTGNCGGHNFGSAGTPGPMVECEPLHQVLAEAAPGPIRMMKLDIEGFEYKVLERYFSEVSSQDRPEYLLVEIQGGPAPEAEKQRLRKLIYDCRYKPVRDDLNTLFKKCDSA
jgi:FkbM family methyltransferase